MFRWFKMLFSRFVKATDCEKKGPSPEERLAGSRQEVAHSVIAVRKANERNAEAFARVMEEFTQVWNDKQLDPKHDRGR